MNTEQRLNQAFSDLSAIRRAIERGGPAPEAGGVRSIVLGANLLIQAVALALAVGIAIFEVFSGHLSTASMLAADRFEALRVNGLFNTGILLSALIALFYLRVLQAARRADQGCAQFMAKNFVQLKNLSFVSDLAVKFAMAALLVLAGRAEWIAPLLVIFTGDYLLQGRFFTLPLLTALGLGVACLAAGLLFFYFQVTLLIWPCLIFAAVAAVSIAGLVEERHGADAAEAA